MSTAIIVCDGVQFTENLLDYKNENNRDADKDGQCDEYCESVQHWLVTSFYLQGNGRSCILSLVLTDEHGVIPRLEFEYALGFVARSIWRGSLDNSASSFGEGDKSCHGRHSTSMMMQSGFAFMHCSRA